MSEIPPTEPDRQPLAETSYREALKSTTIIGAATAVTLACNIIRGKFAAVLLQSEGLGLVGMYNAITATLATAAGFGISTSGVRQIAEAASTGSKERLARTALAVRRICLLLGVVGSLLMLALAWPISWWSFGDPQHTPALMLLAPVVFCTVVSAGQMALLQGVRRVGDLARLNIIGALAGTLIGVPILWWWLEQGIVPLLLVVGSTALLASWWFARQVPLSAVVLSWGDTFQTARWLLKLGIALMVSALLANLVGWLTRVIVWRQLGADPAGQFHAAWTLSGMYVGFILQAMGADYYPRLTAVAGDHRNLNRSVNEQLEISLLLAVPGIIATLSLAPLILRLFYSGEFQPAAEVLRWQMLGVLLRVASWVLGFVLLAKSSSGLYLGTEVTINVLQVALVWLGCGWFGLPGSGMAFFGTYLIYFGLIFVIVQRMTAFRLSTVNFRQLGWMFPAVGAAFAAGSLLTATWAMAMGGLLTLVTGFLSLRALAALLPDSRWSRLARRLLPWLR